MVKTLPSKTGDGSSVPVWGTKISRVATCGKTNRQKPTIGIGKASQVKTERGRFATWTNYKSQGGKSSPLSLHLPGLLMFPENAMRVSDLCSSCFLYRILFSKPLCHVSPSSNSPNLVIISSIEFFGIVICTINLIPDITLVLHLLKT